LNWTISSKRRGSGSRRLRDRICAEFEAIEREAQSDASFDYMPWERVDPDGAPGGGGVRGLMKGRVFEKVGVNVSTVGGRFSEEFAKAIHGAAEDPRFFATGISLVAHMANPHVPAVHMNTRFLVTTKRWFGGGADLNPPIPYEEDTDAFHARLRAACAAHDQTYYDRFKRWADEYFFLPHRGVHRGVGGIFYDHLECTRAGTTFDANLAFHPRRGRGVPRHLPAARAAADGNALLAEDKARQLEWRGRYAEFNLIYDRGTLFGLKTGGNIDAILMSLPPVATWS
jgi:coproporphyrinogen III oxidase